MDKAYDFIMKDRIQGKNKGSIHSALKGLS